MQIGILEPSCFSEQAIARLERLGKVVSYVGGPLDSFLRDKEVLFIRLSFFVDAAFFSKATKLKFLCTPTTGLNHIDLKSAEEKNIQVISLKGEKDFLSQIRATPEHAFGLVLALIRNYKFAFLNVRNPDWDRDRYRGEELYENTVGIVGLGRVGKLLARYFLCFGSKVFYYDIDPQIPSLTGAVREDSAEQLITDVNIVVLAAAYSEENKGYFGQRHLDMLQNKYFVNISRGELLDEACLIRKLEENAFKGVALDVISGEHTGANLNRLIALTKNRNLILTPHIGGATYRSMHMTEEFIASKLIDQIASQG